MTALRPSQPDRPFHGLWSLWEIMEFFPASIFVKCISNIDRHYEGFSVSRFGKWAAFRSIKDQDRKSFGLIYDGIRRMCVNLELTASAATLQKMIDCVSDPSGTYGKFFALGPEFSGRFIDEMENRHVYALSLQEAELVQNPTKGWEGAVKQFPSASYDITESSLCLAMQRSTAAAFHSIRSLEAAIRALARCLGIPDPTRARDRNWGAVLTTVRNEIDRRWPTSTNRMSGDGEFFDSAYAALAAMQNPWRNATMHLDQTYTEEDAAHLHEVIKGFMRKIASRCDENGEPKA